MNGLIFYVPKIAVTFNPIESILRLGGNTLGDNWYVWEADGAFVSVCRYEDEHSEHQAEMLEILNYLVPDRLGYLIGWSGVELGDRLLYRFLKSMPQESGVIVDNGYGLVCHFEQVRDLPLACWIRSSELPAMK